MQKQDKAFFERLTEDRLENARVMEKQSMGGVKRTVVEKYSDQAHFIYELLQNADDAKATEAHFELYDDRLIFRHNGTRHFTVSDPQREADDTKQGQCGDINAITSIGNSNKTTAQIGKFGVGFKAVFQYTAEPEIYDAYYQFKIERLVVPQLLDHDYPGRKKNETVFVFPFKDKDVAYKDISSKLKKLAYPILFLENLKLLDFTIGEDRGHYDKIIGETSDFNGTILEKLTIQNTIDGEDSLEHLWMFSRKEEHGFRYSVGFFIDEEGHLTPKELPAFCFFKTKEVTHLNFIIHAPFLLTDSREGIMAGEDYNRQLIQELAKLAADSIVLMRDLENLGHRMIDDKILDIIPIRRSDFVGDDDDVISFMPFYGCILEQFTTAEIIPTEDDYVSKDNAYWAMTADIQKVFSCEQLQELTGNEEAEWVFRNLKRGSGYDIETYVKSIVNEKIDDDEIFEGITEEFIETQPMDWLHVFYKWIAKNSDRIALAKYKPVLLDQDGKAAMAYRLFLPEQNVSGYRFVHADLLRNEDTRVFLENGLGLKKPTIMDYVRQHVIPKVKNDDQDLQMVEYFLPIFLAYQSCKKGQLDEFIRELKRLRLVPCIRLQDSKEIRTRGFEAHFPDPQLTEMLKFDCNAILVRYSDLVDMIKRIGLANAESEVRNFLRLLGVKESFAISEKIIYPPYPNYFPRPHTAWENRYSISYSEDIVPCFNGALSHIVQNKDKAVSLALWKALFYFLNTKSYELQTPARYVFGRITGCCKYFFHAPRQIEFESSNQRNLKSFKWLLNSRGEWVCPAEITADELPECYEHDDDYFDLVAQFIGLKKESPKVVVEEPRGQLPEELQRKIAMADQFEAAGIKSPEDMAKALALFKKDKEQEERRQNAPQQPREASKAAEHTHASTAENVPHVSEGKASGEARYSDDKDDDEFIRQAVKRRESRRQSFKADNWESKLTDKDQDDELHDEDELMPALCSSEEQLKKLKLRQDQDFDRSLALNKLQNRISQAKKYSYGWVSSLLKLERMYSVENTAQSRAVAIDFGKVEREPQSQRTLLLKHPSRYIPQFMEELNDIPLVLHMQEGMKKLIIEAANVQSYTLKVKVMPGTDLDSIDFDDVCQASITAMSPQFLLEELQERFKELGEENHFEDAFNMKENLPRNLRFIFGPPGTGKTTHLAKEVLIPLMEQDAKPCRVLVLTPTNKSADVLVRRVMDESEDDNYRDWLVRFGATADEVIESHGALKDRNMDPRVKGKNVTVTTIARFPYDYFLSDGARLYLREINWDYIVIDEASMIPLASILYPLFKKTPQQFIIAGDPFQIEPIVAADNWKYETIYTMVKLDSFEHPVTEPHAYDVKLLTTQYRSIPEVGEIFSKFAYDGVLGHYRKSGNSKTLNWGPGLDVSVLNIIKFPTSKYESIYKAKRLNHSSSYQVYSALFAYELIRQLADRLARYNPEKPVSMGVIAPYKAQADMIDRLLSRESFPEGISVHVGTIHGFQGDECDIIFSVFNPPPAISTSGQMFLNKRNIINVSISRARDYLFVLMPDDDTENVENLKLVKRMEALMKDSGICKEFKSSEWEEIMFKNPKFLEENTFSTNHQSVNVYGTPEQRYEVRTEEQAVDVQIHGRRSHL